MESPEQRFPSELGQVRAQLEAAGDKQLAALVAETARRQAELEARFPEAFESVDAAVEKRNAIRKSLNNDPEFQARNRAVVDAGKAIKDYEQQADPNLAQLEADSKAYIDSLKSSDAQMNRTMIQRTMNRRTFLSRTALKTVYTAHFVGAYGNAPTIEGVTTQGGDVDFGENRIIDAQFHPPTNPASASRCRLCRKHDETSPSSSASAASVATGPTQRSNPRRRQVAEFYDRFDRAIEPGGGISLHHVDFGPVS